jgi:hypothetical protein
MSDVIMLCGSDEFSIYGTVAKHHSAGLVFFIASVFTC